MTANVLCPGPSLATVEVVPADFTIGVNRAATFKGCDIWCSLDFDFIKHQHEKILGNPILLTCKDSIRILARDTAFVWRGIVKFISELIPWMPADHQNNWPLFSMTSAIVYAAHAGASEVNLWGCDWKGTSDYDGAQAGSNRTPQRWSQEMTVCLLHLFPEMERRGVKVVRHTLEGIL